MKQSRVISIIAFLAVVLPLWMIASSRTAPQDGFKGIATNQPAYLTATNASSTCPNGTSTVIVPSIGATNNGMIRYTAVFSNVGTSSAYLCPNATCTAGVGIIIPPTTSGTINSFQQSDDYRGPWSCIGASVSSSLSVTYSQF